MQLEIASSYAGAVVVERRRVHRGMEVFSLDALNLPRFWKQRRHRPSQLRTRRGAVQAQREFFQKAAKLCVILELLAQVEITFAGSADWARRGS